MGQIIQSHPFFIKDARNGNISRGPEERRAQFLGLTWLEGNVRSQGLWVWMTRSTMSAGAQCGIALRAQAGLWQPCKPRGAGLGLRAAGESEEFQAASGGRVSPVSAAGSMPAAREYLCVFARCRGLAGVFPFSPLC